MAADEYQQVAALLSMEIDVLDDMIERSDDADTLRQMIHDLKERKDKIISDPKHRNMRYAASCLLFSLEVEK